ncbi:hypothetical protein FISHEDRAFT_59654 [Fistulina hepatica ATCC 64428]|uniref:Transmembrane protein n=1 Tax=Fistulina hepatica ATCC 64428 TaxID=1128425 RepID=A0A0D7A8Q4_9AGAR|nr:hypothetical protein FISHEDRAFT_59654 [Fistulina hepatica ATCC 64428]
MSGGTGFCMATGRNEIAYEPHEALQHGRSCSSAHGRSLDILPKPEERVHAHTRTSEVTGPDQMQAPWGSRHAERGEISTSITCRPATDDDVDTASGSGKSEGAKESPEEQTSRADYKVQSFNIIHIRMYSRARAVGQAGKPGGWQRRKRHRYPINAATCRGPSEVLGRELRQKIAISSCRIRWAVLFKECRHVQEEGGDGPHESRFIPRQCIFFGPGFKWAPVVIASPIDILNLNNVEVHCKKRRPNWTRAPGHGCTLFAGAAVMAAGFAAFAMGLRRNDRKKDERDGNTDYHTVMRDASQTGKKEVAVLSSSDAKGPASPTSQHNAKHETVSNSERSGEDRFAQPAPQRSRNDDPAVPYTKCVAPESGQKH